MQIGQLSQIKSWFDTYTQSFLTGDPSKDSPLILKIDHTDRVCSNICILGRALGLSDSHLRLAETVGLLHDVGRFEQLRRFGTFDDRQSVNHAALGIEVLKKNAVLENLEADEQAMVMDAVRFHNAPELPNRRLPANLLFMHLIRDADKLDIWKLFADYFRADQPPDPTIVQHLPDHPSWEEAIIEAITQKRMARFQDMKSLNDFKLLQLSWVFDLNFQETSIQAKKRGDLTTIATSLPDAPAVQRAVDATMQRLDELALVASK